ncbi:MAG: alpha/beta hydrolase [Aquisalimonadaceae bacterium]
MALADGGHLEAGGKRLEYQWFGPGPDAAPTLVFLHEGLGCAALWRDFPRRVVEATGCGALVYSRAGYGSSDPVDVPRPLRYMHIEGLEVVPAVLDAAGIREAVLVGHSDGASISVINAGGLADPRVRAIALLAPHVFNEEMCVASIREARVAYETTNLRERMARYHGDNVDCAFWGWNRAWLDPEFMHWNIEEYLPAINVPVLAIQGRQDEYGSKLQIEAIERQVPAPVRTVWLDDCRHSPHKDQADTTLEALSGFIAETASTGRAPSATESFTR